MEKCPFCGIGTVSTLDHYLPKSKYPALAITPKNMIPACRDCNWERKGHFLLRTQRRNRYIRWFWRCWTGYLAVREIWSCGQRVSSYLFCAETCSVERLAVQAGWESYGFIYLYTSYAVHAAEEITGRSGIWHVFLDRCGEDFLAASFHDEAVSREQLFLNSWQSALTADWRSILIL